MGNLVISKDLLEMLCCPATHQGLSVAEPALLERLNQNISAGQLRNRAGQIVSERLEGGLIREDCKFLYPLRHGTPIMLVDQAIPLGDIR